MSEGAAGNAWVRNRKRDVSQQRDLDDQNHNGILKVIEITTEEETIHEVDGGHYDNYHTWVS
jgi:hypothetical protein